MANDPLVGIVTPCRNRREKTARFLRGLLAQHYRAFRIYLVDSNSSDGTPEMVRRSFPEVELLAADDDKFWTGATNVGVRRALSDGCDYILTINDDSLVGPEWLRSMVDEAVRTSVDILASRIDFLHQPGQLWALGAYNDWAAGKLFQLPDNGIWADESAELASGKVTFPVQTLCGNGVLFRRIVFEKIGLYDEVWTPHYHADSEFVLRARQRGFIPHITTLAVLRNDVFNDAAGAGATRPDAPPEVRPADFRSLWQRFAFDFRKLFLNIRSDLYWRALLMYVWRHCPRRLLVQCASNLVSLLWKRYFERNWKVFRSPRHVVSAPPDQTGAGVRLWRQPLEPSRAPVPRGEFSMDVLDSVDAASVDRFVEAAFAGIFGRRPDGDISGFQELARSREGRDTVLRALLNSLEAQLISLGRRVTPLAVRMMKWRESPTIVLTSGLQHLCEDIDRLSTLEGRELVEAAYREFLRRTPEPGIMRMQAAAAEHSPERLLAALLLSQEYRMEERRRPSPMLDRWSQWVSASRVHDNQMIREEPVHRLANAVAK